jgi:endonuclease YncB( thermonuclease family)
MPNPIPASTVLVSLLDSVEFSEPGPRVLGLQIDGPAAVPPHSECSDLRHPHGDVVLTLSDRLRPLGLTGVALLTLAVADRARGESTPCVGEVIASGIARAVIDGRTFVLDDGREVRLAAIEVPQLLTAEGLARTAAAGSAVRAALEHLVLGQQITLQRLGPTPDRYGRLSGHVFATSSGAANSVQLAMIGTGQARVAARVAERICAVDFLLRERAARSAKLGLWADSDYDIQHADKAADILAHRGQFAVVEGKVLSVRESGATIYLNFGRRWSEDFTVTILKRNERTFSAGGIEPKKLEGRRIMVRGWIEERGGPWIDATHPEQIEIADRN